MAVLVLRQQFDCQRSKQVPGKEMNIYKDALPAEWSYALKPSKLEGAIAHETIQLPVSLSQCFKVWSIDAPILSTRFYPRGSYNGGADGSFWITSCAVPSDKRAASQDFAEEVFLPALLAWIKSVEALPYESPMKREEQYFACEGSPLALSKRPLPLEHKGAKRRKRA